MRTFILISLLSMLVTACGGMSYKMKQPSVTSKPTSADVYANGVKIGETPLNANLYKEFPSGWSNGVLSARGNLIIKKSGCDDYVVKVSDHILKEPIHVVLNCSVESNVGTKLKAPTVEKDLRAIQSDSSIESRLQKLEVLFKKGLITEKEYQQTRQRILKEL